MGFIQVRLWEGEWKSFYSILTFELCTVWGFGCRKGGDDQSSNPDGLSANEIERGNRTKLDDYVDKRRFCLSSSLTDNGTNGITKKTKAS